MTIFECCCQTCSPPRQTRKEDKKDMTIFEAVGGSEVFERLAGEFYTAIATDPILRPIYPDDLEEPRRRLTLFLIQLFGGPQTYSEDRGHPRLRMRHLRFPITQAARDAWVGHMTAALAKVELPERERQVMQRYFEDTATFLINRDG